MSDPRIYLDCDGVLADFAGRLRAISGLEMNRDFGGPLGNAKGTTNLWNIIGADTRFYAELELLPDALALYEAVRHLDPIILTGVPKSFPWAEEHKREWGARHFPGVPMICCESADKRNHCAPGDVLVDDWIKYSDLWDGAGGHFILHTDTPSSLEVLWALYPEFQA